MRWLNISATLRTGPLHTNYKQEDKVANFLTIIHECEDYPTWKKGI